jgi:predicted dehydrogenase
MRIAVVGAGRQARRRASVIATSADAEVVVVPALPITSAAKLAREVHADASTDWASSVVRPDVDAVIVCTPPDLHAEIAVTALRAGKHVLCEKPLARSSAEAQRMVDEAQAAGRILWCGFNHRYHPAIRQVREWLEQGHLGEAMYLRARYGISGRPGYEHEWRADPKRVSGGQLMEQGIHLVDLARWLLGDFATALGSLGTYYWKTQPLEDNAFAILRKADGRVAMLHSSLTEWRNLFSLELFGTDAYARAEGLGGSYGLETAVLGIRDFNAPFAERHIEYRGADPCWQMEWEAFVAATEGNGDGVATARDGVQALRIVEAVYASASSGNCVSLEQ